MAMEEDDSHVNTKSFYKQEFAWKYIEPPCSFSLGTLIQKLYPDNFPVHCLASSIETVFPGSFRLFTLRPAY